MSNGGYAIIKNIILQKNISIGTYALEISDDIDETFVSNDSKIKLNADFQDACQIYKTIPSTGSAFKIVIV